MRLILVYILLSVILLSIFSVTVNAAEVQELKSFEENGVCLQEPGARRVEGKVLLNGKTGKEKIKILLIKENQQTWLNVELKDDCFSEIVWLSQGIGKYSIYIMVHEYDRKYSYGPGLELENTLEYNRFLVPAKDVESDKSDIINLAYELTSGCQNEQEMVTAIYNWIVKNIEYDYTKYNRHLNGDYGSEYGALNTLRTRKGVCYDYAALMAALSRAAGVQAKVIKGRASIGSYQGLHAWNEIYISQENKWVNVDTTYGSFSGKGCFENENFEETHFKISEY